MQTYVKRPMPVDAIQWTGENAAELPEGSVANVSGTARQISDGRKSQVIPPRHAGVRLLNGAVVVVNVGDYIVMGVRGPLQVRRQGEFEAEYQVMGTVGDDATEPEGRDRPQLIQDAIAQLDPENTEHWTKDKRPQVPALEHVLGFNISAGERDEAWEAVREAQE